MDGWVKKEGIMGNRLVNFINCNISLDLASRELFRA